MGQIGSGFSLVFFKFWSGFSPDFTLFGPEIKLGALHVTSEKTSQVKEVIRQSLR